MKLDTWHVRAVVLPTLFFAQAAAAAKPVSENELIGVWAPKTQKNCRLGRDDGPLELTPDHRAHFFKEDYLWYLAEDIIVLKKPSAEKDDLQPPVAGLIISKPQANILNVTLFILGDLSAFAASMFRCPK